MSADRKRLGVRERNGAYATRLLAGIVAALTVMIGAFHLPVRITPQAVGWQVIRDEVIAIEDIRFEDGISAAPSIIQSSVPPLASERSTEESSGAESSAGDQGEDRSEEAGTSRVSQVRQMERLVMAAAETMPEIRGGLGAYYINIDYPQSAIDSGVEGRLVLDFIVEADGRPSEIEIYQSLHPLCDSAAVRALRKTLFMPGRTDGEAVAVRMRLPVLFQILDTSKPDSLNAGLGLN